MNSEFNYINKCLGAGVFFLAVTPTRKFSSIFNLRLKFYACAQC